MLPFTLKISWFVLSLTGLLSCWATFWSFGRVVGTKWASIVYCLGLTFAQGIFCLGIVYHMDPFLMARPFCLAQNALMSAGIFINMGVVFALTLATNRTVRKPKTWGDARRALQWQKIFWLPVVIAPFLATISYLALSFSFRSVRPSDGMWCDSTEPEWFRLLGPSGVPFLLSIPVLHLSIQSLLRIRKTNLHLLRSRPECPIPPTNIPRTGSQRKNSHLSLRDVAMIPVTLALTISKKSSVVSMRFWKKKSEVGCVGVSINAVAPKKTSLQCQRERLSLQETGTGSPSLPPTLLPLALRSSGGSAESSPNASEIAIRHIGMGERNTLEVHDITLERRRTSSRLSLQDDKLDLEAIDSNFSSTFPTLAKDEVPGSMRKSSSDSKLTSTRDRGEIGTPIRQLFRISLAGAGDEAGPDLHEGPPARSKLDPRHSSLHAIDLIPNEPVSGDERQSDRDMKFMVDVEALPGVEDTEADSTAKRSSISSFVKKGSPAALVFTLDGPFKKPKHQPACLAPALWHVIIFQFVFIFIQFLAFLTTFVDVVSGQRTPSRFGSQHLALLLAAWCPVVIFGSLPVVRKNLVPWRPISIS